MKKIVRRPLSLAAILFFSASVAAQINIKSPGQSVQIGNGGDINVSAEGINSVASEGNEASVNIGGIADGANIQGVTVINGRVSIDGKEIPPNVSRYKSPKSGTVYLIQRKGSSVSVATENGPQK